MSLRNHYKLVGAAGAAALTLGALAGPALAAGPSTAAVTYTCPTTNFGDLHPSATFSVKQAPATMAAGQGLGTTSVFTLDAGTTGLAIGGLNWVTFNGTITSKATATKAGLDLKIAKTTLGNGAGGSTDAPASGKTLAGTKVGAFTFNLGALDLVTLTGFDASGKKINSISFPTTGSFGKCANAAGTTTLMDATPAAVTTKVVKDSTTTKDKAKYTAKKKSATGTATIKSKFGIVPTGKVTFTLKKGSKTVKTAKGTLKKGVAKVTFKKVSAKGKYSITTKYAGSANLKGSKGKATFKVK